MIESSQPREWPPADRTADGATGGLDVDLDHLAAVTKKDLDHLTVVLRGEMQGLRSDLQADIANLKSSLLMWMIPTMLASVMVGVTFARLTA